jgi:hypothetical protein
MTRYHRGITIYSDCDLAKTDSEYLVSCQIVVYRLGLVPRRPGGQINRIFAPEVLGTEPLSQELTQIANADGDLALAPEISNPVGSDS